MNRDEAELIDLYYNIIGACVEQICLATVRFSMIVNVKSVNSYLTVLYNMLQLQCCHIFTTPNINQDGHGYKRKHDYAREFVTAACLFRHFLFE